MLLSKSTVNTCAVIKNRRCLTCKTANKCLNFRESVKMTDRNKDGPLPSPAIL